MEWLSQQLDALREPEHPGHRRLKFIILAATALIALWIFSSIPGQQGPQSIASIPISSLPPAGLADQQGEASVEVGANDQVELSLVVHVVGKVLEPGVYLLPLGSRVHDAVAMAGGFSEEAEPASVNLARALNDGEQLWVLSVEEHSSAAVASSPQGATAQINLNRADSLALESLPGIGPTLASRIVDYRSANGPFAKVSDLMRVSGIGEKLFSGLKDLVTT